MLDAAARHLSLTRAAAELAVMPAVVGQQIHALEDTQGVVLFRRTSRGLQLTLEGARGLKALRVGFLQFEDSVRAMQHGQSSNMLTIAAPRDFSRRWLLLRIGDYGRERPELRFHFIAADEPIDFTDANLDLAVRLTADPGDCEGIKLAPAEAAWVGEGERICWEGGHENIRLTVADAGLAPDAAIVGLGRVRVPRLLAEADPAAKSTSTEKERRAYWLLAPLPQWRQRKVRALVAALAG